MDILNALGLFLLIAGFVVGLGAVTVIDIHGFLGRRSGYWTEATTRTHKVTKPLIWFGLALTIIGGTLFYHGDSLHPTLMLHLVSLPIMILNGAFLTFFVSPFMLNQEREGRSTDLLPRSLQWKIVLSFIISFVLWWGNLIALVLFVSAPIV